MEGEIVTEARSQTSLPVAPSFLTAWPSEDTFSHSKNVDHQSEAMDKSVELGLWLRSKGSDSEAGVLEGSAERK